MAEPFDPYYKWLGIAPQDQPPTHYRLLGVELYEDDPEVIDAAANRVMAYVETCAQGPQAAQGQKILQEVSAARTCLLDERKKARYDAQLGRQSGAATPARKQRCDQPPSGAPPADPSPLALNFADNPPPAAPTPSAKPGKSGKRAAKARGWKEYALWLSPAVVLLVAAGIYLATSQKPEQTVIKQYQQRPVFNSPEDLKAGFEPVKAADLSGKVLDDNEAVPKGIWVPTRIRGEGKNVGVFFQLAQSGDNVMTFSVPSSVNGSFEVRMSYVPAPDRATNVKVQVFPAGGKPVGMTVNQQKAPAIDGLFHSLGTFTFQGGNDERIEISAQGADGSVVVDAVQFVRAGGAKQ